MEACLLQCPGQQADPARDGGGRQEHPRQEAEDRQDHPPHNLHSLKVAVSQKGAKLHIFYCSQMLTQFIFVTSMSMYRNSKDRAVGSGTLKHT